MDLTATYIPGLETIILQLGILLYVGVLISKVSDRFGVPLLLLFLFVGMMAGSEGIGQIAFESHEVAQGFGTIALLVILYAGGLDSNWSDIKPALVPGLVLSNLGVVLTTFFLGIFIYFTLGDYSQFQFGTSGISLVHALLIAAIVSSTDAAAVFSVYRSSPILPSKKLRNLLEFESGSNDPIAVLITTAIIGYMLSPGGSIGAIAQSLVIQFVVGAISGLVVGYLGAKLIESIKLSVSGLYPIGILSVGLITFGLADSLNGNGFLAVYIAGVVVSNMLTHRRVLFQHFHDGLSWFMQMSMFIILGLLVFPSQLIAVAPVAITLALFLTFVARPLSVFIGLLPFKFTLREKAYISWVGLRGSVPIILATYPATSGIPEAQTIFHLVFFIVLTSIVVQGFSVISCTKWLQVEEKPSPKANPSDRKTEK